MKPNKITRDIMTNRKKWLKAWFRYRNYDLEAKRKDFIFIYYCTLLALHTAKHAQKMISAINQQLSEPLAEEIVSSTVRTVNAAGGYRLTNETIIDTLGITPAEVEKLKIGQTLKEKDDRTRRQLDRVIYEDKVKELYESGKRIAEIAAAVPNLSRRTIERTIQNQGKARKTKRNREIWEMADTGHTVSAIAEQLNCSEPTVRRVLKGTKPPNITTTESLSDINDAPRFADPAGEALYCLYKGETEQATPKDYDAALGELQATRRNVRIVGTGGTGKTQLIKDYLRSLPPSERSGTLVVAPTGLAASHIGGETIHKAFGLLNEVQTKETPTNIPSSLMTVKRLIIDEVSMLRVDIFEKVVSTLQQIEELEHRKCQIIVCGDFGQLQPVCTSEDREQLRQLYPKAKGIYAFHSELWQELDFQPIVLRYNFRQEDKEFDDQLTALKYGSFDAVRWFNLNCSPFTDDRAVYICPKNADVEKYNREALERFEGQKISVFQASTPKELDPNTELPCPKVLHLAEGMRIMTIANDRKYKNGSLGTILKVNENSIRVLFDNCTIATVRRKKFTLPGGSVYDQLPVVLAYSFTVHKCQGCTFDAVVIVPGFFAAGQLYTALSRCRSRDSICIDGELKNEDVIVDMEALQMTI